MALAPITNFIQVIPGYLQNRAQSNQGLPTLAHELVWDFNFTGLAQVELDEWNSDWSVQAEWIYRLALPERPRVIIVAYSWGAGFGFTNLARQLRDRGVLIEHAILSDPVFHLGPRWFHTLGGLFLAQARAYYPFSHCTQKLCELGLLPPRPTIRVPDNVLAVDYYIQQNSPLRGHELVADNPSTILNRHSIDFRTHTNMDDCPEFRMKCREVCQRTFNPQLIYAKQSRI